MFEIIFSLVLSVAAFGVLAWGSTVRDAMAREGMEHGAGLMPAGGATEIG